MSISIETKIDGAAGIGVAGNFAGHLEQAGEASDFTALEGIPKNMPKGVFPFYMPGHGSFLGVKPVSHSKLRHVAGAGNYQVEPEVALVCDLEYSNERVCSIKPKHFAAFNDCSIRKPNAKKISEKKNWGPASKGMSANMIELDNLEPGGTLDRYRLASFLKRDGECHVYGLDSPVVGYSCFHSTLLDWTVDKLANQADEGPLENIGEILKESGLPQRAVISIGATNYTPYGESTFLEPEDEVVVVLYDSVTRTAEDVVTLAEGSDTPTDGICLLRQLVYAG